LTTVAPLYQFRAPAFSVSPHLRKRHAPKCPSARHCRQIRIFGCPCATRPVAYSAPREAARTVAYSIGYANTCREVRPGMTLVCVAASVKPCRVVQPCATRHEMSLRRCSCATRGEAPAPPASCPAAAERTTGSASPRGTLPPCAVRCPRHRSSAAPRSCRRKEWRSAPRHR
jgi:hypothetical protein